MKRSGRLFFKMGMFKIPTVHLITSGPAPGRVNLLDAALSFLQRVSGRVGTLTITDREFSFVVDEEETK